jgi:hypothetical protein
MRIPGQAEQHSGAGRTHFSRVVLQSGDRRNPQQRKEKTFLRRKDLLASAAVRAHPGMLFDFAGMRK